MRILLVEDDIRIASFVVKGLRENSYAVDHVVDGDQAVYRVEINPYDLLILDVNLPIASGFEVCRRVRDGGAKMPILMLTARDAIEDRVKGLDCGADDYLVKPFDFSELLARLRALLRRHREIRSEKIVTADLELDTRSQTVTRSGKRVSLTAKEYSLLEYLVLNEGRVLGREEIAEHVWNETFDPFSNLIEVYIKRLRDKIDEGHDVRLIHTRRGAGYCFGDV
jgi:two-component system copper resistance phosphate regulon response regulator CusR